MIDIRKLILYRMKMTLNEPFSTSFGTLDKKEFFIVEMMDNLGNRGFGESVAFSSPWYTEETVQTNLHMIVDFLVPILKKEPIKHPNVISDLFSPIKRNNMAKAALEGAIWDLFAKQQQISLAKALGGKKTEIDVGISLGIETTITSLLRKIEKYVLEGYKRVKIKIKPGYDIDVLKEVRLHFPTIPIMVDANSAYTLNDIDHLRRLDDLNLMMIEQPLGHDDIVDHATLQSKMETPICLDESIHSLTDVKEAIELGSCKIINIKIGRVGGLTKAKEIHDYCEQKGIDVWCGGMLEAGVGRAHNIALSSLSHFGLPGDTAGSSRYWQKDIIEPEVVVENGVIPVPTKPGIGYNIDDTALQAFCIEKKEITF